MPLDKLAYPWKVRVGEVKEREEEGQSSTHQPAMQRCSDAAMQHICSLHHTVLSPHSRLCTHVVGFPVRPSAPKRRPLLCHSPRPHTHPRLLPLTQPTARFASPRLSSRSLPWNVLSVPIRLLQSPSLTRTPSHQQSTYTASRSWLSLLSSQPASLCLAALSCLSSCIFTRHNINPPSPSVLPLPALPFHRLSRCLLSCLLALFVCAATVLCCWRAHDLSLRALPYTFLCVSSPNVQPQCVQCYCNTTLDALCNAHAYSRQYHAPFPLLPPPPH